MRIGMFGTFDVENYGDLLFPIIAEHELKQRLNNVEIIRYSYNEKNESSWRYNVRSLADLLGNSTSIQELDCILIGGGHLIRFDKQVANQYQPPLSQIPHPTGYWLAPALAGIAAGIPVLWNAPSSSDEFPLWAHGLLAFALEKSAYVSVRDRLSFEALRRYGFEGACNIVPDTVFSLPRHFPRASLSARVDELLSSIGLRKKYIVIQATAGLESVTKALLSKADILSDFDILILPIGPILGDDVSQVLDFLPQARYLPVWPSPEEIAGLIAHSSGVIAMSLHLSITALDYGLPVLRPTAARSQKYAFLQSSENVYFGGVDNLDGIMAFIQSVQSNDPHLCSLVKEAQSKIEEHWDRIAEICQRPQRYRSPLANDFSQANLLLVRQENLGKTMADHEEFVQALTAQVVEKEQSVQALTAQVVEKEQSVQALTAQVAEKEQSVQALTAQVVEKEQSVQALTAQVAEKDEQLKKWGQIWADLESGLAWRLMQKIRGSYHKIAPYGGRGDKFIRLMVRTLAVWWREGFKAMVQKISNRIFGNDAGFVYNKVAARSYRSMSHLPASLSQKARQIEESGLFDHEWYLQDNPDIQKSRINPVEHYLTVGIKNERNPNPLFNTSIYTKSMNGLVAPGDAFLHFSESGRLFAPGAYRNADVLMMAQQRYQRELNMECLGDTRTKPRKYAVYFQCGAGSIHEKWLVRNSVNWDFLVNHYDQTYEGKIPCDIEFRQSGGVPGTKFTSFNDLLTKWAHFLDDYEYILLLDDDIHIEEKDIDRLFQIADENGLDLAQASLSHDSHCAHPIFKTSDKDKLRFINAVEIMMPVLSRRAIQLGGHLLGQTVSGWGLDTVMGKLCADYGGSAVIDDVVARHTKPINVEQGAFYKMLHSAYIYPEIELTHFQRIYHVGRSFYRVDQRFKKSQG